jgi:hypothetical protein
MWLFLNDAFLSIVHKDCPEGSLLVRARRPGDIEKVFGRRTKVTRATDADYLYRAVIERDEVTRAIQREVLRIDYGNFKDSISDRDLHDAAARVWGAMASLQNPPPYSEPYRAAKWVPVGPEVAWRPGGEAEDTQTRLRYLTEHPGGVVNKDRVGALAEKNLVAGFMKNSKKEHPSKIEAEMLYGKKKRRKKK